MIPLETMENAFQGQECFVLGNGPSLNRTPGLARALQGKLVISCNHIYKLLTPRFLCCSDPDMYLPNKTVIDTQPCIKVLSFCDSFRSAEPLPPDGIRVHRVMTEMADAKPQAFDLSPAYNGWSVILDCCLQFAFFVGCATAYLLGCDCTTDGHFYDPREPRVDPDLVFGRVKRNYRAAKDAYERNGRKILNATVGGTLEVFDRVNVSQLLDVEVL